MRVNDENMQDSYRTEIRKYTKIAPRTIGGGLAFKTSIELNERLVLYIIL